jgi:hypothetical protein
MALTDTVYHLLMVGEHLGNRTENGFYFADKATTLQDHRLESLVKLMNDFIEWVVPSYALRCSSSWHGLGLIGQVLAPDPQYILESGFDTLSGGQDAESLPADNAVVVAMDSGLAGRSFRGRVFLPAVAKDATEGDYLSGSAFAQLSDFADSLAGRFSLSGTSLDHVYSIYSRKIGDVRHAGPPVRVEHRAIGMVPVQAMHPRRLICSMRRRRPDHGI